MPLAPDDLSASTEQLEAAVLGSIPGAIASRVVIPARPARFGQTPAGLHPALEALLPQRLYQHQCDALQGYLNGCDVIQTTGTGSGKSVGLIFPALDVLLREPDATVIMLYPTKALARDQIKKIRACGRVMDLSPSGDAFELSLGEGLPTIVVGSDNSDVAPDDRALVSENARLLVTTPDQLHSSFLPQARRRTQLMRRLTMVVLDEVHCYTDELGPRMCALLRRLDLVVAHVRGTAPQMLMASATISEPTEFFSALTGRGAVTAVTDDCSARHEQVLLVVEAPQEPDRGWSPADIDVELIVGIARHYGGSPPGGVFFFESKAHIESVRAAVADRLQETGYESAKAAMGAYSGSVHAKARVEAENRIKSGKQRITLATSALEMGVDLHTLRFSVTRRGRLTQAELRQRIGRSGRGGPGLGVVIIGAPTVGAWPVDAQSVIDEVLGELRRTPLPCPTRESARTVLIEGLLTDLGHLPSSIERWVNPSDVAEWSTAFEAKRRHSGGTQALSPFRQDTNHYRVVTENDSDFALAVLDPSATVRHAWVGGVVRDHQGNAYKVISVKPRRKVVIVRRCHEAEDSRASVIARVERETEQPARHHGLARVIRTEGTIVFERLKAEVLDDGRWSSRPAAAGIRCVETGPTSITLIELPRPNGAATLDELAVLLQSCLDEIGVGRYEVFATVAEGLVCLYSASCGGSAAAWAAADNFDTLINVAHQRLARHGGLMTHHGWVPALRFKPLLALTEPADSDVAA